MSKLEEKLVLLKSDGMSSYTLSVEKTDDSQPIADELCDMIDAYNSGQFKPFKFNDSNKRGY